MTKKELGQFYTTNAEYIIGPLVPLMRSFMRGNPTIVDPFVGNWDLLNAIEGNKIVDHS
jgi:hypothetical protein